MKFPLRGVSSIWSGFLFVSKLNHPLMWFLYASEFYRLQNLGNLWLISSPFALFLRRTLGFSACSRSGDLFRSPALILSCTSTPLQRFASKLAAFFYITHTAACSFKESTSLGFLAFQHIRSCEPFFSHLIQIASNKIYLSY